MRDLFSIRDQDWNVHGWKFWTPDNGIPWNWNKIHASTAGVSQKYESCSHRSRWGTLAWRDGRNTHTKLIFLTETWRVGRRQGFPRFQRPMDGLILLSNMAINLLYTATTTGTLSRLRTAKEESTLTYLPPTHFIVREQQGQKFSQSKAFVKKWRTVCQTVWWKRRAKKVLQLRFECM